MKNFFKKLSFVLAVAMVLTSLAPATASAASSYIYKSGNVSALTNNAVTLWIGDAKTDLNVMLNGKKTNDGTWKSGNTKVVKVSDKGVLTPVANGGTRVKFTSKSGKEVEVKVYVRTRAHSIKLFDGSDVERKALESPIELEVGQEFKLWLGLGVSAKAKAAGAKESTYKTHAEVTGDAEALAIEQHSARKYTVKAEKAGEATVTIGAGSTSKANTRTATVTFKVVDAEAVKNVAQNKYNEFKMEFATAEAAKAAVEETAKSLVKGEAHVTEDEKVVAVKENGANGELINAFIEEITVAEGSNIVNVKMFSDLKENTVYTVLFGGKEYSFKACEWIPVKLAGDSTYTPNPDETQGGTANLIYDVYAVGDQGQDVDIKDKLDGIGSISFEDMAKEPDYSKYSFAGESIDFYANNVVVNVKATFTWYTTEENEEKTITDTFAVTTRDQRQYKVLGYEVVKDDHDKVDPAKKDDKYVANVCYGDEVRYLLVEIGVDDDADGIYDDDILHYESAVVVNNGKGTDAESDDEVITFKSSNIDKLNVDEQTGGLYAPKAVNDTVNVYVYYKDKYAGAVPVKVAAKRTLSDLTIDVKSASTKYSYSDNVEDKTLQYPVKSEDVKFEITAKDQTKEKYDNVSLEIIKTTDVLDDAKSEIKIDGAVSDLKKNGKQDITNFNGEELTFSATTDYKAVKTVQYKVVATDLETNKQIVKVFSFTVKNTTGDTVLSTKVIDHKNGEFSVYGMSSAGYAVCGYYLTEKFNANHTEDLLTVDVVNAANGKSVSTTAIKNDEGYVERIKLETKWDGVDTSIAKVSSSVKFYGNASAKAINVNGLDGEGFVEAATKHDVESYVYLADGKYQVKAYEYRDVSERLVIKSALTYTHKNSLPVDGFQWEGAYSAEEDIAPVIDDALRFNISTKADRNEDGVEEWAVDKENKGVKFEDKDANYVISYVENKNGSITFMDLYRILDDNHIVVLPIRRTVYTGYEK